MHMSNQLRDIGLDIHSLCPIRVGDGSYTFFGMMFGRERSLLQLFFIVLVLGTFRDATVRDWMATGWETHTPRRCPIGGTEQ